MPCFGVLSVYLCGQKYTGAVVCRGSGSSICFDARAGPGNYQAVSFNRPHGVAWFRSVFCPVLKKFTGEGGENDGTLLIFL